MKCCSSRSRSTWLNVSKYCVRLCNYVNTLCVSMILACTHVCWRAISVHSVLCIACCASLLWVFSPSFLARQRYRVREERRQSDDRGGRGGSYQWNDKRSSWRDSNSTGQNSAASIKYTRQSGATSSATPNAVDQTATYAQGATSYASYAQTSSVTAQFAAQAANVPATSMAYGVYPYQNGTTGYAYQTMQYATANQPVMQQQQQQQLYYAPPPPPPPPPPPGQ